MLHKIKKQKSRRPTVSQTSEEKLVRDKCGTCKKLFLAIRPNNHDMKTCDNCLSLKKIPPLVQEKKVEKIEKTFSEQVQKMRKSPDTSLSRPFEEVQFEEELEDNKIENVFEDSFTVLPCRLGSYTVHHRILHDGYFLSIGDIVSMHSEGVNYYAQITVFIENVFCEKYAGLIWLLPTSMRANAAVGFDPHAFTYGPQDERFYDVRQLKFVMHPPTRFYKRFISPVPKNSNINLGLKHRHKVNSKRKS